MSKWNKIWETRHVDESQEFSFQDLINLNGFDSDHSRLTEESLSDTISTYEKIIGLQENDNIFEVGCGSGAFLYTWYERGHEVGGIDISPALINVINKSLPLGDWNVSEAIDLPIDRYDHIVSFSTFFYFPNYEYAKEVLYKMIMKANKTVSIFDIADLGKKEDCENWRKNNIIGYSDKYTELQHLYYSKEWWCNILNDLGVNYKIYEQNIQGYGNSQWRYNITINI